MDNAPLILLAAGGTGGHLFPAEALAVELMKRGLRVRLATDSRALRYSGLFSKEMIDVVPSETVRGRTPWSLAYTGIKLAAGTGVALNLMRRLRPAAVVGFGGYPTLPPLLAARLAGIPGIIHEANAVLGRANRFCRAGSMRSRPRFRACSIAIRRWLRRRRRSARRCVRRSLLRRR
jgi:UDP-N-acetylglucosamine--N-acetylmuramyl-(pentapeptide) pyrophosphoryl-undecaprenol N-acetylglucosamine transferase